MMPAFLPAALLRRILLLGAHLDDIEIGCGGTMHHLQRHYPEAEFLWVVFTANSAREEEAAAKVAG